MSDPILNDSFAFEAFDGGLGIRLTATATSSSGKIPGTQAVRNLRIVASNGGNVSAFIRFGPPSIVATLDCMEILAGTQLVFSFPELLPSALYVAVITEQSQQTFVQFTAGRGF